MRVNPNSEPLSGNALGVTRTPSQIGARETRLEVEKSSLTTAEGLNSALAQVPATRAEKVAQAKLLIEDAHYPPLELIQKISSLIARHVGAQVGPNQGASD